MTSRSKTVYQGRRLERVHRSELEDSTMRDHARQSARLEESLRTVDRAKNVMIKSMEADRKLFARSGVGSKTKVSRSAVRAREPNSTSTPHAQHPRLIPDMRVRKPSQSDNGSAEQPDSVVNRPEPPTQRAGPSPDQEPGSLYEHHLPGRSGLLRSNNGDVKVPDESARSFGTVHGNTSSTSGVNGVSRSTRTPVSGERTSTKGSNPNDNSNNSAVAVDRNSTLQQRDLTQEESSRLSPGKQNNIDETDSAEQTSAMLQHNENPKSASTATRTKAQGSSQSKGQETNLYKKSSVWDTLSAPKHSSPLRSKRTQLEREFHPLANSSTSSRKTKKAHQRSPQPVGSISRT